MQRNLVSHSKRNTIGHAHPNLRLMRIKTGGAVRAVWVCMKCLKKGSVIPSLSRRFTRPATTAS